MAGPAGLVIATGGGAVLNPVNRQALAAGGVLICLEADPVTILERLAGQDDRPLLTAPDRMTRIAELLAQRAPAYAAVPHRLDTSRLSVEAAAERVLGIAAGLPKGGHRLIVDSESANQRISEQHLVTLSPCHPVTLLPVRTYDVLIANGLLAQAGQRIVAAGLAPGRCAVVTNPTVGQLYAGKLTVTLIEAGFEPLIFEVPDGETYKTLETAAGLYERFAGAKLARDEPVIALGGGVIGDMAGFVAATWLRGVPFVQIPTSLLAMVDASVGGKVAVDLPQGKNLVGAFKQPELVLIDPALLTTLPEAELRSGMAELLKAGVIGDPLLFEQLARSTGEQETHHAPRTTHHTKPEPDFVEMIAAAVRVKARIVERDPFEAGDRAWLNLGHTFGHSLELLSGYTLRHGEAVAIGMVAAAGLSASLGYCDAFLPARIRAAVEGLGLPTRYAFDPATALAAMGADKKRRGRTLRFVLIRQIGKVEVIENVPEATILDALEKMRAA
jgi:3-dehydroquinate synthase